MTRTGIIATLGNLISASSEDTADTRTVQKISRRWIWWSYPFCVLFWALYVFTPSKKDAILIVAGGGTLNFLTTDSTAKQIPHELSTFVVSELKNMAQEAKVDLNIQSQKEKIIEEAKNMTGMEIVDKMKTDSLFRTIMLNK